MRSSLQTELEKVTREKAELENNVIARGMELKVKEEELDQSKMEAEMYKNSTVKLAKEKWEKSKLEVGVENETDELKECDQRGG